MTCVGDAPYGSITILADEKSAVLGDRDTDRPAPDIVVIDDKPGYEVLLGAGRHTIVEAEANHLVADVAGGAGQQNIQLASTVEGKMQ